MAAAWCHAFDFSAAPGDWSPAQFGGVHAQGAWRTTDFSYSSNPVYYRRSLDIGRDFPTTTITALRVEFTYAAGGFYVQAVAGGRSFWSV